MEQEKVKNKLQIGVGLDCAVISIKDTECYLLQTCDYFYPIVDNPYLMGRITCANVVSDLYAVGVLNIDCIQMLIKTTDAMSINESIIINELLIKGFKDAAAEVGCKVSNIRMLTNPWCTIGGVASTVSKLNEFILPEKAVDGDVLVLTKPLGTQIACQVHHWLDIPDKHQKILNVLSITSLENVFKQAMFSMARLNKTSAVLMHKYEAHCATDVTGFGILGHAQNLAKYQLESVDFLIDKLPVFENVDVVAKTLNMLKLSQGISPETSGGLLIALSRDAAIGFCKEIEEIENHPAFIVGSVVRGENKASLSQEPVFIPVPFLEE